MVRGTALPARTRRLFPVSDPALTLEDHAGYLTARLLEDGDGEDLRWLVRALGRERLRAWVGEHGGRGLLRRSRAFWALLLEIDPMPRPGAAAADSLWPLA
jgi:hypothetical protein